MPNENNLSNFISVVIVWCYVRRWQGKILDTPERVAPKAAQKSIKTRRKTSRTFVGLITKIIGNTLKMCQKLSDLSAMLKALEQKERGQNDSLRKNARAGL